MKTSNVQRPTSNVQVGQRFPAGQSRLTSPRFVGEQLDSPACRRATRLESTLGLTFVQIQGVVARARQAGIARINPPAPRATHQLRGRNVRTIAEFLAGLNPGFTFTHHALPEIARPSFNFAIRAFVARGLVAVAERGSRGHVARFQKTFNATGLHSPARLTPPGGALTSRAAGADVLPSTINYQLSTAP